MDARTHGGMRSTIMPLSQRYQYDQMYYIKRLQDRFATDTLFSDMKSLHGNACFQVYSYKTGFVACYPQLNTKRDSIGEYIENFVHDFGASEHLSFDGFSSQVGNKTRFYKNLRKYSIEHHVSAPQQPNKTLAECAKREIKRRFYQFMERKRVPKRVWDYPAVWVCETGKLSVSDSWYANGWTAIEIVTVYWLWILRLDEIPIQHWIGWNHHREVVVRLQQGRTVDGILDHHFLRQNYFMRQHTMTNRIRAGHRRVLVVAEEFWWATCW